MTEIEKVRRAVVIGGCSSPEVQMETELPIRHCASYLRRLELAGRIQRTGSTVPAVPKGRAAVFYEPVVKGIPNARTAT